ncbi:MAG TPA: hypothetical protein VG758_12205 [Hyphomicrobiaceae bacterium]|nr:hypothetical protein [Hyphomicrobiaceae bacterium]
MPRDNGAPKPKGEGAQYGEEGRRMKTWIGWRTVLVLAGVTALLLLPGINDLPDQERLAVTNVLVLVAFGAGWMQLHRLFHGDGAWQRRVQAWARRPMTQWNDWRIIGLLAGIAFGLYFLALVDLPDRDKWSSAFILLLLALCLAVQMVNVAFFRRRGRK